MTGERTSSDGPAGSLGEDTVAAAKENLGRAVTLGGTCVAIFTFTMFFLHPLLRSGYVNPILFRVAVADILFGLFVFLYAASSYYWGLASLKTDRARAELRLRRGERCISFAILLLALEPAVILFTVNLPDLGTLAVGLWVVYVALAIFSLPPRAARASPLEKGPLA